MKHSSLRQQSEQDQVNSANRGRTSAIVDNSAAAASQRQRMNLMSSSPQASVEQQRMQVLQSASGGNALPAQCAGAMAESIVQRVINPNELKARSKMFYERLVSSGFPKLHPKAWAQFMQDSTTVDQLTAKVEQYKENAAKEMREAAEREKQVRKEAHRQEQEQLSLEAAERREGERIAREKALEQKRIRDEKLRAKAEQRLALFGHFGPVDGRWKQMYAPQVGQETKEGFAHRDLIFRGMSVNNVRNLQRGEGEDPKVFNAQNPNGAAGAVAHIVNDDRDSPYLSFEAMSMAVSAGKYALKPVDRHSKKPLGVTRSEDGFLKQEKSYTAKSRRDYADALRIGYVGGITGEGVTTFDYSTPSKATALTDPEMGGTVEQREKAEVLAIADREVLVKPGAEGVKKSNLPFVSKVKEVPKDYYVRHLNNQTRKKALGYYKSTGGEPTYYKTQVDERFSVPGYGFEPNRALTRAEDESDREMSDIEDMSFSEEEH